MPVYLPPLTSCIIGRAELTSYAPTSRSLWRWSLPLTQSVLFGFAKIQSFISSKVQAFACCNPQLSMWRLTLCRYTGNRTVQIGYDGRPIQLKSDIAQLTFMLDAGINLLFVLAGCPNICPVDFTPLFNWNTKLLFVFITAHFKSKKHVNLFLTLSLSYKFSRRSIKLLYGIKLWKVRKQILFTKMW